MEEKTLISKAEDFNYKEIEHKFKTILGKYLKEGENKKRYDLDKLEKKTRKIIYEVGNNISHLNYSDKYKIISKVRVMLDEMEYQLFGFVK
jgi:hypothetical protein